MYRVGGLAEHADNAFRWILIERSRSTRIRRLGRVLVTHEHALSLANGAAYRALNGHLSAKGKGHADPEDLIDDLLAYLGRKTLPSGLKRRKRQVPF